MVSFLLLLRFYFDACSGCELVKHWLADEHEIQLKFLISGVIISLTWEDHFILMNFKIFYSYFVISSMRSIYFLECASSFQNFSQTLLKVLEKMKIRHNVSFGTLWEIFGKGYSTRLNITYPAKAKLTQYPIDVYSMYVHLFIRFRGLKFRP